MYSTHHQPYQIFT